MWTTVIELLWKYKSVVIIGMLSIALFAMYGYADLAKKDKEAEIALNSALQEQLRISQHSVTELQGSINTQNQKILDLQSAANAKLEASKDNLAKANESASKLNDDADALLAQQLPKNAVACKSANELFNQELKNALN